VYPLQTPFRSGDYRVPRHFLHAAPYGNIMSPFSSPLSPPFECPASSIPSCPISLFFSPFSTIRSPVLPLTCHSTYLCMSGRFEPLPLIHTVPPPIQFLTFTHVVQSTSSFFLFAVDPPPPPPNLLSPRLSTFSVSSVTICQFD